MRKGKDTTIISAEGNLEERIENNGMPNKLEQRQNAKCYVIAALQSSPILWSLVIQ